MKIAREPLFATRQKRERQPDGSSLGTIVG